MVASVCSVAALIFTILLHCFTGLNSQLNVAINSALAVLWALSWSLLTWYMSGTLRNLCDITHWNEDTGIMVCRIYKTLFAFTLTGLFVVTTMLSCNILADNSVQAFHTRSPRPRYLRPPPANQSRHLSPPRCRYQESSGSGPRSFHRRRSGAELRLRRACGAS